MTEPSSPRSSSENEFWTSVGVVAASAAGSSSAPKLLRPCARILPACSSSANAPTVSSSGVAGAGAGGQARDSMIGRTPTRSRQMPFELPPLPYDFNALEPHIDARTMEIHHDKHHQAYVDNANKALDGNEWADRPVEAVIANVELL